jgi:hypothetical protein
MATPEELAAIAGGAAAALTPARPSWERKETSITPAAGEAAALEVTWAAEARTQEAIRQEGDLNAQAANLEAEKARQAEQAAAAEKALRAEAEADIVRRTAARDAEERGLIDKRAKSRIAAGQAKAKFLGQGTVGGFLQALVRAVAAGEQARQGKDGISPAERILNDRMAAYEQSVMAEAENDAELAELKIKDRPRFDAAMTAIRHEVSKKVAEDLKVTWSAADAAIAKLKPDQQRAAAELKAAIEAKKDAENEAKRQEGLRGRVEFERREKTAAAGAAGAGGKPTEGTRKSAGQAVLIMESLKDDLDAPPVSRKGLATMNQKRAMARAGEKAPLADALLGMTPAEGDTEGLTDADKAAVARSSVLTDTITYLTSGAAVTPDEAKRKLDQLRILPSDGPQAKRAKLTNAIRFAEAAASQSGPNWTPAHAEMLQELKAQVSAIGARPKAPGAGKGPMRGGDDISAVPTADLQEALRNASRNARAPENAAAIHEIGKELDRRKKEAAGGR